MQKYPSGEGIRLISVNARGSIPLFCILNCNKKGNNMPIYKRCPRCRKRIPSGTTCSCIKQDIKEKNKAYDKYKRNQDSKCFYNSKPWNVVKEKEKAQTGGIDLYAYYVEHKVVPATMVHHMIPIKEDWDKRLDTKNLFPCSAQSHALFHEMIKKGEMEALNVILCWLKKRFKEEGGGEKSFFDFF